MSRDQDARERGREGPHLPVRRPARPVQARTHWQSTPFQVEGSGLRRRVAIADESSKPQNGLQNATAQARD